MKFASLLGLALAFCASAWASDKHGGHEVAAGKYHIELVVKDKDLTFYVRGQGDKPVDSKSITASANVLSGKDKATVPLASDGDALKGRVPFAIAKDAKIVLTFSVASGKSEQARFSLGAKADHKGHKH